MRNAPKVKNLLIFLKYIYEFISKTARLALKRCLPAACLRKMLSIIIKPFIIFFLSFCVFAELVQCSTLIHS